MNLYQAINGDMSSTIFVFAPNAKQARKHVKKKIKDDELEHHFPVIDLIKYKIQEGIIDAINVSDF